MIPSFLFQVGAPASFRYLIRDLQSQGIIYFLTDLLIPFLLIFSIMFAILQKAKIFKDSTGSGANAAETANTKINATISFLIGLLVVIPHVIGAYDPTKDPVTIIKNILPGGVLILVVILLVMAMLFMAQGKTPSVLTFLIAISGIFFLFYIIAAAVFPNMSWGPLKDPGMQVLLISLLIAGLWIYFLFKKPDDTERHKRLKWFGFDPPTT